MTIHKVKRKLAAILSADVKATAGSWEDGERTVYNDGIVERRGTLEIEDFKQILGFPENAIIQD